MRNRWSALFLAVGSVCAASVRAGEYQPDPPSVQRFGPAYRYPQAGWIVLHIEGEPYERGVQHGRLLATEIAANLRSFAATQCPKDPIGGWKLTRELGNVLFLRQYDREFLEEMKGIADGASAEGARFDGRPLDLLDIATLNVWPEIDTLGSALEALPTGLEGHRFPADLLKDMPKSKPMRCSAFAATAPATKDGKIVFGHITMFSLYPSNYYNLWLDVKPAKGHRVLMQSYPGGIQSGMDYYLNDAGIMVSETTISQTRLDAKGMALASRIRKALQYGDSIDSVVSILKDGNNGLYTNEWLLADTKTNEIAMFELGTHKMRLWRSSKNEWFGGTEGFYWGCNNTKDLDVRLEAVASVQGRPAATVFYPSDRDKTWLKLYDRYKGQIDADFGKLAFTTPPLAAYHSLDAKFTTSDMAKGLSTWALFGPPLGRTWEPTREERDRYPEVRPLVSNPWTVLHPGRPAPSPADAVAAVDLRTPLSPSDAKKEERQRERRSRAEAAWHGTLFPKTDGDIWLATAFARYEGIVAMETALPKDTKEGKLTERDRDKMALALFACRTDFELGARAGSDVPLAKIRSDVRRDEWYRIASGKGVLLLNELRQQVGPDAFDDMMNRFGKEYAGKTVTTDMFCEFVRTASGKKLDEFFDAWLQRPGLPDAVRNRSGPFAVTTFYAELEQTLIVYGTADELATNREAAEALQQAIRARHANITVPAKADRDVTADDLAKNHLLLIGRPDSNRVVERLAKALPVKFGTRSVRVRDEVYAHAGTAVVAAAANPENPRFSVVVVAGMDAYSTWRTAPQLPQMPAAEVVVLPNGGTAKPLVLAVETKKPEQNTGR
jgi:hypothetical protein